MSFFQDTTGQQSKVDVRQFFSAKRKPSESLVWKIQKKAISERGRDLRMGSDFIH